MSTISPNLQKPSSQDKGLIPESVKLVLLLVLFIAVAYLFYDGIQSKSNNTAQLAKMADQIKNLEDAGKLSEASITSQVSNLKSDFAGTQQAVGSTQAEFKKTAAQIQAEGQKN